MTTRGKKQIPKMVFVMDVGAAFSVLALSLVLSHGEACAAVLLQKTLEYKTAPGDYGGIISWKLGMEWAHIARSHGCMRLRPEVAELLFKELPTGTQGKILYRPVKMAKTKDGRVFLEVYRDFYKMGINYDDEVKRLLREMNAANDVCWIRIEEAVKKKDGIVRDVTK